MRMTTTFRALSPKLQNYRKAEQLGCGFLANVILTSHQNPARKLRGLVRLLEAGRQVTLGSFSIDTLLLDGELIAWKSLETV